MKKRIITILFACILLAFGIFGIRTLMLHAQYKFPNQAYFGENYKEIFYPTSPSDWKIANALMKDIDNAFSFVGSADAAKEKYGVLSRYSIDCEENEKLTEEHKLKFITADFEDNAGYIWIEYSQKAYEDNGDLERGSQGILVRMTAEKKNDNWVITGCREHP